jgi:hypothetical protein
MGGSWECGSYRLHWTEEQLSVRSCLPNIAGPRVHFPSLLFLACFLLMGKESPQRSQSAFPYFLFQLLNQRDDLSEIPYEYRGNGMSFLHSLITAPRTCEFMRWEQHLVQTHNSIKRGIWRSYGSKNKNYCLEGCDAVRSGRHVSSAFKWRQHATSETSSKLPTCGWRKDQGIQWISRWNF